MNTKGSIKVDEGSERPHFCRKASSTKTRVPGKKTHNLCEILEFKIFMSHAMELFSESHTCVSVFVIAVFVKNINTLGDYFILRTI